MGYSKVKNAWYIHDFKENGSFSSVGGKIVKSNEAIEKFWSETRAFVKRRSFDNVLEDSNCLLPEIIPQKK